MSRPTLFISGITGGQGSAAARQAIAENWVVRGITRNPDSAAAKSLASEGAIINKGDWDDEAALATAMAGSTHLLLSLVPAFEDASIELKRAQRILRLAKAAGVRHAIYSGSLRLPTAAESSLSEAHQAAVEGSLMSVFISVKASIEAELRGSGFETWVILRPGFMMTNFLRPKVAFYGDLDRTGTWTTSFGPDTRLPLVDSQDIARFAIAAARDPARFHGRIVPVASELRTPDEVVGALRHASGKQIRARHIEGDELEAALEKQPLVIVGQLVIPDLATQVDMEQTRGWGIPLTSFEDFLTRQEQAVAETYGDL
ncbi:hypothetical protein BX600DRAFT_437848 [Xylariales sp. PMI_506]|nr:hypothetical protein BX600DRAFT_437848 [Xylariales sp. PMI_506]